MRVEKIYDEICGDEYWFAIYRMGNWNMNLWSRVKYAWRVLIKGEAYRDQITLDETEFDAFKEYINKL